MLPSTSFGGSITAPGAPTSRPLPTVPLCASQPRRSPSAWCGHSRQSARLCHVRRGPALHAATESSGSYDLSRSSAAATDAEPGADPSATQQLERLSSNTSASGSKLAVLRASKTAVYPVEEKGRPLAEYMTLPASQYSVLDAQRIERLGQSTFRCYVGGLNFLNIAVEPVLTVSVDVAERGPTVRLLSTKLEGSKFVTSANDKFDATMTNTVRWRDQPDDLGKELTSDTTIQVVVEVPRWCSFIPVSAIESSGSGVLQGVLNSMVPRFLAQLGRDYHAWAAGDVSRKPVGDGEI